MAQFHFSRLGYSRPSAIVPLAALGLVLTLSGCGVLPQGEAQAQSQPPGGAPGGRLPAVETALAEAGSLEEVLEYTGTTAPIREVSLRSQAEGRLLDLTADVGDRVNQGEVLGRLDDRLLASLTNQSQAELATRQSEVSQAQTEVSDARVQVEQARVELQQAQADAARLQALALEGAIPEQEAEQAQTAALRAEQMVRSAEERVRTREQAVIAARGRVAAQESSLEEVRERQGFSSIFAPLTGSVLERLVEPGDLVRPGDAVLRLGDFSAIRVMVQVSELDLGNIQVGQSAQVRLDAFPDRPLQGQVSRISPAADPTARLIPVEVTIPNEGNRIGSGLLARVQFQSQGADRVIVPASALEVAGNEQNPTLFVLMEAGEEASVVARSVQVGDRNNGQVEILSGLEPGEAFVVRSSDALEDGQGVRLSILSQSRPAAGGRPASEDRAPGRSGNPNPPRN